MFLFSIFTLASLFSILGGTQEIKIPDPLIEALFGIAIFSIAAFLKSDIPGGDYNGIYNPRRKS